MGSGPQPIYEGLLITQSHPPSFRSPALSTAHNQIAIDLLLTPTPPPKLPHHLYSICRLARLEQNVRSLPYPQKLGPLFLLHCYVGQSPRTCGGPRLTSSQRYKELPRESRLHRISCLGHLVSDSHLKSFEFVPKSTKRVADFCTARTISISEKIRPW